MSGQRRRTAAVARRMRYIETIIVTNIVAIIAKAYFTVFPLFFAFTPPLNFAKLQFCEVAYILISSPAEYRITCYGHRIA